MLADQARKLWLAMLDYNMPVQCREMLLLTARCMARGW